MLEIQGPRVSVVQKYFVDRGLVAAREAATASGCSTCPLSVERLTFRSFACTVVFQSWFGITTCIYSYITYLGAP